MTIADQIEAEFKEIVDEINDNVRLGKGIDEIKKKLRRWCTDEAIERGLNIYRKKYKSHLGSGALLRGEKSRDKMNWYRPDENPSPTSAWGKLRKVLLAKGWAKEHISDLDHESNAVVSNLCAPNSVPQAVKGLVLGYVQSGKTANFSAVTAKATDEGYRLIIVLSGMYNNLRSQTEARLQSELTTPHGGSKAFTLTTADDNGDFKTPTFEANAALDSDKFVLAVIKKNSKRFDLIYEWLSRASDEVLAKSPVLIIDDEADQASINNSKNDDISAINKRIRELISFLSKKSVVTYVGYTATPFANVLIDAREEDDLFPSDFIYSLRAPETYIGTERLFGRDSVDGDAGEEGLNIIRNILPSDVLINDKAKVQPDLTDSMKLAIDCFYLAGAERVRRGHTSDKSHITMLFNTTHLKKEHEKICNLIERYQAEFIAKLEEKEPIFMNRLKKLWNSDFQKTTKTDFIGCDIGSFEELIDCLDLFVNGLSAPIKENSESKTRLDFSQRTWAIVVGGNTLSRGLTIEGLTISYFHRTSKGYDTLLQMGRWFGYRPDYLDLTRIFVTSEMESHFYHLATVEKELREDIYRMQQNEESPIDIALKIRDHDTLNITAKRVLKDNAAFASNTYSGSKFSATHVNLVNREIADLSFRQIQTLLGDLQDGKYKTINKFREFSRSLLYKNVPADIALNFLEKYPFSEYDHRFNYGLLSSYVQNLIKCGELSNWSIALMSQNQTKDDHRVELGVDGLCVYSVDRRQMHSYSSESKDNWVAIKSVTSFRDELIDMDFETDETSILKFIGKGDDRKNLVELRNRRSPQQPLLLIYPIFTNCNTSNEERVELIKGRTLHPIISEIPHLFAFTLVFPPTKQARFNFNYVANATVKGRNVA